jgi:hypothetical protein
MMQLPVLIEPLPEGKGFVARLGDPFNLSATGPTAAEALLSLQAEYRHKLDEGWQVVGLPAPLVPTLPPPGGWLPDDELTREWLDHVEAFRRERDEEDRRILDAESDDKGSP